MLIFERILLCALSKRIKEMNGNEDLGSEIDPELLKHCINIGV